MDKLIAIYRYKNPYNELEQSKGSYYLLHLLTDEGALKPELMHRYCQEFDVDKPQGEVGFGPFESVDEITKFCFHISEDLRLPYIGLHSMDEFNTILEESSKVSDLLEALSSGGNILENIAITQRKTFLQRVFDRS